MLYDTRTHCPFVGSEMRAITPSSDGFSMPAEWEKHDSCLMAWPCNPETFAGYEEKVKASFAEVASAIARFELVTMITHPSLVEEARRMLDTEIEILPMDTDDIWMRDNGPCFVRSSDGRLAVVQFGFNGWGGRFKPFEKDAVVPEKIAHHFGMPLYKSSMVLEGGSICVDGEGTLLTTESCLLNPNRNPRMTRGDIESTLKSYLGIRKILWLKQGLYRSLVDGHIDGIAAFVGPGKIAAARGKDPSDPNFQILEENRDRLETMTDAKGRSLEVIDIPQPRRHEFDGRRVAATFTNFYIANGGVVAPIFGDESDDDAISCLRQLFPEREVVPVRGEYIGLGGGVIHCITQQMPK